MINALNAYPSEPRVLILTLYSGENELEACCAAVRSQQGIACEHKIFRGLDNCTAHETLYTEIMGRREEFDLFLKLDADMVLRRRTAVREAALFMDRHALRRPIDHALFAVHDFMTDHSMMGVHLFSSRVRWKRSNESLFVDPAPSHPGRFVRASHYPAPFVSHMPDPSPFQAFHFGVHRALKATQYHRRDLRIGQAINQWRILERVWAHFARSGDSRLGLATYGADLVWRRQLVLRTSSDYKGTAVQRAFEAVSNCSAEDIRTELAPRWSAGWCRRVVRGKEFLRQLCDTFPAWVRLRR